MTEPRRKKRPTGLIALVIVLALPIGAWLLRGTIATSIARDAIAERGLTCDDRFAVSLSAAFGSATIEPTRCTLEGGLVEAIELTEPATIELDGVSPSSVHAEGLRLTLRDRDVRNGGEWSRELARLNLEQRVAGLVKGLSELSTLGLPPTTIAEAEVMRGGDELGTIAGLSTTPGSPLSLSIDRVVFTAVAGAARLTLSDVTGTATRGTVQLEGQATARAGVAMLGTFSTGGSFSLVASHLDSGDPSFRLRSSF